jgi:prepilin-type N-terminal cleavage/methylation domain-containing protein
MMRNPKLRSRNDDRGFSLIELLVSMVILAILMSVVVAATTTMYRNLRKSTGATDVLDVSRKVVSALDKQVRYANAVTASGAGPSGATYVEWRTGNSSQQQTCTQWRFDPVATTFAYRQWQPMLTLSSPSVASTLTGWRVEGKGIGLPATGSLFSLTSTTGAGAPSTHQQLTVAFTTTAGLQPKSTNRTQVSFTAVNTANATVPGSSVCNEGGRP